MQKQKENNKTKFNTFNKFKPKLSKFKKIQLTKKKNRFYAKRNLKLLKIVNIKNKFCKYRTLK
jgi:hypothetical protein